MSVRQHPQPYADTPPSAEALEQYHLTPIADGDVPSAPAELRPYLFHDPTGSLIVTGKPPGWEVRLRTETRVWIRGTVTSVTGALALAGAITAIAAWGQDGLVAVLSLTLAVGLVIWNPNKARITYQALLFMQPEKVARAAGLPVATLRTRFELPLDLDEVAPIAVPKASMRALHLATALCLIYGITVIGARAGWLPETLRDRVIALVGAGVCFSAGASRWLPRRHPASGGGPHRSALGSSMAAGARTGGMPAAILSSLLAWLPERARSVVVLVGTLLVGLLLTVSAVVPVPAASLAWKISIGALELVGMAAALAILVLAFARAVRARSSATALTAAGKLVISVSLIPVAYWLGVLDRGLAAIEWFGHLL